MNAPDSAPSATALEAIAGRLRALKGLNPIADALADLAAAFRQAVAAKLLAEERELALYRAAGGRLH